MTLSHILFLFVAFAVLVYMLVKENKANSRVPLALRYVASIFAVLALLLLMFPVTYRVSVGDDGHEQQLRILTKGMPGQEIRQLIGQPFVFSADSALSALHGIQFIEDWTSFSAQHPGATIAIHGLGLTTAQLQALSGHPLNYHAAPIPAGFVFCDWPQHITSSSELLVQGTYHNLTDEAVKITLLSASRSVDSVTVPPKGLHLFNLTYGPKQLGNALFGLAATSGGDTLYQEQLPVTIASPERANVVLLAASPSFEHKFLVNWLQEMHYGIAFRARISKDKFSVSYGGGMKGNLSSPLRAATFDGVDMLIADEAELIALSPSEQRLIAGAVQSGMGLLLLAGDAKGASLLGRAFRFAAPRNAAADGLVEMSASLGRHFPKLNLPVSKVIDAASDQQTLLHMDRQAVAATLRYGRGRITATTLMNSYAWWLNGDQEPYAQLWSLLADHTLAKMGKQVYYGHGPRFPTPFVWSEIVLQLPEEDTEIAIEGQFYPTLQHATIPSLYQLSFRPEQEGWHTLDAQGAGKSHFYVYGKKDWQSARDYAMMQATEYFARKHAYPEALPKDDLARDMTEKEVPKWIYFLVFLAASSVLWYASRGYNQNVI